MSRYYAQALSISHRTDWRILHEDLKFHPYKKAVIQELQCQDFARRLAFSKTILGVIKSLE